MVYDRSIIVFVEIKQHHWGHLEGRRLRRFGGFGKAGDRCEPYIFLGTLGNGI
jgi:hypothetical protein